MIASGRLEPHVGDILFARWDIPPQESVAGQLICGRTVIVTAVDDELVTVIPVDPHQEGRFIRLSDGNPVYVDDDGVTVRLVPLNVEPAAQNEAVA